MPNLKFLLIVNIFNSLKNYDFAIIYYLIDMIINKLSLDMI